MMTEPTEPREAERALLGARTAARLGAVQALYQMDLVQSDMADILAEFGATRLGEDFEDGQCGRADFPFLSDIVTGVVREQRRIDPALNDCLAEGWTLARLDSILRAILRAAAYELVARRDVPARVIINEYMEIAHAFFDEDEPGFVNGVLDRLAHNHRAEEFG